MLSFVVALSEIIRRGIWTALRVENEHCTNVGRLLASRDVPLPYKLSTSPSLDPVHPTDEEARHGVSPLVTVPSRTSTTGYDAGRLRARTDTSESSTVRLRRLPSSPLLRRMGSLLHMAHAQDFERRKRPEVDDHDDEESESSDDEADKAEEAEMEESVARVNAKGQEELAEEEESGEDGNSKMRGQGEEEVAATATGEAEAITPGNGVRSLGRGTVLGRSPNSQSFLDIASESVRRKDGREDE